MVTYTRDTRSCHNCGAAIPAQQPYPFCKSCEEQRRACKRRQIEWERQQASLEAQWQTAHQVWQLSTMMEKLQIGEDGK